MDGKIDLVREQRLFQLLDEQAFAAGIGQRTVLDAVARGFDQHDLASNPSPLPQEARYHVGLHAGQF
jgi:hypothetical protein